VLCVYLYVRPIHPWWFSFYCICTYARVADVVKPPYPFLRTELLTRLKTNRPTSMGLAFVPPDSLFFNCSRSCYSD
jgi:hypothetical protein